MKKRLLYVGLAMLLLAQSPLQVCASAIGEIDTPVEPEPTPAPSPSPGDGGGGGGGGGDGGGGGSEEPETPVVLGPQILSFTPTATSLHSINAFLAGSAEAAPTGVYFLPYLEDFPVNLADTAAHLVDTAGNVHNFAAVYTGAFDSEVAYFSAITDTDNTARLITSKKVYDSTDNSRALTLMGYDLLLANEQCDITTNEDVVSVSYRPELVGNYAMRTETVVMDIYKALQQYEWDIEFVWCKDDTLTLDTNPIQNQFSVPINDTLETGIDTAEGATWVWASRSNPELYWDRVDKDCVFNGGAHYATTNATNIEGTKTSVSFSKTRTATMTMGEFCAIARAMMELYGEPVITEKETLLMLQNYTLDLPVGASQEITDAVEYLAAKGILRPDEIELEKTVTFADIETILCRIADVDSRLTFKYTDYNMNSELVQKGYVETEVNLDDNNIIGLDEITNPLANSYNDYFVEAKDGVTNLLVTEDGGLTTRLIATNLLCNGSDSEEIFINMGITPTGYYHFRIHSSIQTATISHVLDESSQVVSGLSYTLTGGGGVYDISDSNTIEHMTLDEAEYSHLYIDADRRASGQMWEGETFLSDDYHWYGVDIEYTDEKDLKASIGAIKYNFVSIGNLFSLSQDNVPYTDGTNAVTVWRREDKTSAQGNNVARYVIQVKASSSEFYKQFSWDTGTTSASHTANSYYRKDGTLLVSCDFLKQKNRLDSFTDLGGGIFLLTCDSSNARSNVYLFTTTGKILVNNTLYDAQGEDLVIKVATTTYINYRACLGWTYDIMTLNSNGTVTAFTKVSFPDVNINHTAKSISNSFPQTSFFVDHITSTVGSNKTKQGFLMSAAYPLSNYMIVMGDHITSLEDTAFIWYRRKANIGGNTIDLGDDSVARQQFATLTGMSLDGVSKDFYLRSVTLNRSKETGGFRYIAIRNSTQSRTEPVLELGYIYTPDSYTSIYSAIKDYYDVSSTKCLLPIIELNSRCFSINMNMCANDSVSPLNTYGTLPYRFQTGNAKDDNKLASLLDSGKVGSSWKSDLSNVYIYPAPVGLFQSVIGIPKKEVKTVYTEGANVYYGSSRCTVENGGSALTIGGLLLTEATGTQVVPLYLGTASHSVYGYSSVEMGVNTEFETAGWSNVLQQVLSADVVVDWEKYTFRRLIQSIDSWSTILLIFTLNVLPRLGMLVFFILMILSLIADVRPWIIFNERVIDVYKILTFGRQSVHTIDFKRTFVMSLICLTFFVMFLDGMLFNVIIWCSKLFIYLTQH